MRDFLPSLLVLLVLVQHTYSTVTDWRRGGDAERCITHTRTENDARTRGEPEQGAKADGHERPLRGIPCRTGVLDVGGGGHVCETPPPPPVDKLAHARRRSSEI